MRVALDCRSVFPGMGGIGRATAALARELPAHLAGDELLLLRGARRAPEPIVRVANVREVDVEAAMIDAAFEQARLPGLLAELEADVFHGTCFAVPMATEVPRIATVHDVVFRRRPELVDADLREHLDRWTRVSCALAETIVTVSQGARDDIATIYDREPSSIEVVPNAVDEALFTLERRPPRGAPFILYVGSIEEKKNITALLRAFDALLRLEPSLPHVLVLCGSAGGAAFDLEAALATVPASRGRVRALGHVPDRVLLELYASADLFVYLSEHEGFGLPPLEAMAAGVPTIVSDRPALPEVVGDGARIVEPRDDAAVAASMIALLRDANARHALVARGRARARQYSWTTSARRLAALYRRLGGQR